MADTETAHNAPEVTQLRLLMEQDFGDLEGKKWTDIQAEVQNKPGFVAVETKEAMGRRAETFLDEHLLPLLGKTTGSEDITVAVVSHGIFLSTLWKRLLRRLPARSVTLSPDLQSTARPTLEHLGGWSNTGYLSLHMTRDKAERSPRLADAASSPTLEPDKASPIQLRSGDTLGAVEATEAAALETTGKTEVSQAPRADPAEAVDPTPAAAAPTSPTTPRSSTPGSTFGWSTTIMAINAKDHLKGHKRTGGGVGSSRHDSSQKGIESFFKRRKVD